MNNKTIYDAPALEIVECTVERGFSDSDITNGTTIPGFDDENKI